MAKSELQLAQDNLAALSQKSGLTQEELLTQIMTFIDDNGAVDQPKRIEFSQNLEALNPDEPGSKNLTIIIGLNQLARGRLLKRLPLKK